MYTLKPGIKRDPVRRWALPDRIFFGFGGCHILAGVYLRRPPLPGFHAERIIPTGDLAGNHVYVTDGEIAYDFHGYSAKRSLLRHHTDAWSDHYGGDWNCTIEQVDFDLLDTRQLNRRKMLGPDQYQGDAAARARAFIDRMDHRRGIERARKTLLQDR